MNDTEQPAVAETAVHVCVFDYLFCIIVTLWLGRSLSWASVVVPFFLVAVWLCVFGVFLYGFVMCLAFIIVPVIYGSDERVTSRL